MKIPPLSLPDALAPLKALPTLKMGLAELTRARRSWTSAFSQPSAVAQPGQATGAAAVLEEVQGFGANPGGLRMLRFVPPGLPPGAPLVVVLHGCTQTAAGYDKGSGWSTLAARHGFALLYPEQQRANNGNLCFNWFETGDVTRGQGEVASIRSMVQSTIVSLKTDPARVFVTGLSAGGAMTAAMLATYPDVFAAGAIIAGLPYGSAASTQEALGAMFHPPARLASERGEVVRKASPAPRRKPIVSIWHGDADNTVVPGNATEQVKQWCDVHGLSERDGVADLVDGVPHRSWRSADGVTRVELFTIPGLAHGTPINPAAAEDRGVGSPMPHMLASGISSTWHIAHGWGLLAH